MVPNVLMSTHTDILKRFTGPAELSDVTGMSRNAAKQVWRRGSISARHWQPIVSAKKATLKELAEAAASKTEAA